MEHYQQLEWQIPASSLLRSLQGIAVALKAPSDLYDCVLSSFPQKAAPVNGASDVKSINGGCSTNGDREASMSAEEWYLILVQRDTNEWSTDAMILFDFAVAVSILRMASRDEKDISPQQLDAIWSLVHGATVTTETSRLTCTTSRSAQGFLAVPLCSLLIDGKIDELFRFHVWLADGNRGTKAVAVHSHQAFAQSWILAGRGTNCGYEVDVPDDISSMTHAKYQLRWTDASQSKRAYVTHQISSTVSNTGDLVRVSPRSNNIHTRDMSYVVPAGAYHSSEVHPGVLHATLFFFDSHQGFVEDAAVVGPIDGKEYTQLRDSRGVTASDLAKMVYSARSREKAEPRAITGNSYNFVFAAR